MNRALTLSLVVGSTIIGLIGTDLILPAVPQLPEALGGDPALAQLVLAAPAPVCLLSARSVIASPPIVFSSGR